MFEQLFTLPRAVERYSRAPLLEERLRYLRAWLGHVSLDTTNVYAETDLEMKAAALAHCEVKGSSKPTKGWRQDAGLMAFLKSL